MDNTINYNLKKPSGDDFYNIQDFNDNADIIDNTLKGLDFNKVENISGKGLSSNDFTTAEKVKLAGIATGAQANTVTSVASKTGAVSLVKGDVGLSNIDNTADADKTVAMAVKLRYARTINNIMFDGSASITIADNTKAPLRHTSTGIMYGEATTANYGHVKLARNSGATEQNSVVPYSYMYDTLAVDLNSYNTTGTFVFYNVSTATNFPDGIWVGTNNSSHLEVKSFYVSQALSQTLYKKGTNEVWIRFSISSSWSEWERFGNTNVPILSGSDPAVIKPGTIWIRSDL